MCLSELARVVAVDADACSATVDLAGREIVVSTVALGLDAPPVEIGEWLVVHTGLAVERLDDEDARQIFAARERFAARSDGGGPPT